MQEKGFYLPLSRSACLISYSLIVHCLAVISVSLLAVEFIFKMLFVIGLVVSLLVHFFRLGVIGQYPKRPSMLLNPDKEYWQIRYADNSLSTDLLLKSAWVTRLAVIVHFKSADDQHVSIVVVKDSVDKEHYRQLRVRIRLAFFQQ